MSPEVTNISTGSPGSRRITAKMRMLTSSTTRAAWTSRRAIYALTRLRSYPARSLGNLRSGGAALAPVRAPTFGNLRVSPAALASVRSGAAGRVARTPFGLLPCISEVRSGTVVERGQRARQTDAPVVHQDRSEARSPRPAAV